MDPDSTRRHHRRGGITGVGIGTKEDWERLADLLRKRRGALGYLHRNPFNAARAKALGIKPLSRRTAYEIEKGTRNTYQVPTLEKVAIIYDTTAESMLAVIRGDADALARRPAEPRPRPARTRGRHVSAAAEAGAKVAAVKPYADAIMERLLEAGGGDPPGDVLFPDHPMDAETWDRRRRMGWTAIQRVWLIAELRRGEAEGGDPVTLAG
jgi:transcriptional regulator with XRE-family HTH domain